MESMITYSVCGWVDKHDWVTFRKTGYKTKNGAFRMMKRLIEDGFYGQVILRERIISDEHPDVYISGVIYFWDDKKGWIVYDGKDVTEHNQH